MLLQLNKTENSENNLFNNVGTDFEKRKLKLMKNYESYKIL